MTKARGRRELVDDGVTKWSRRYDKMKTAKDLFFSLRYLGLVAASTQS